MSSLDLFYILFALCRLLVLFSPSLSYAVGTRCTLLPASCCSHTGSFCRRLPGTVPAWWLCCPSPCSCQRSQQRQHRADTVLLEVDCCWWPLRPFWLLSWYLEYLLNTSIVHTVRLGLSCACLAHGSYKGRNELSSAINGRWVTIRIKEWLLDSAQ